MSNNATKRGRDPEVPILLPIQEDQIPTRRSRLLTITSPLNMDSPLLKSDTQTQNMRSDWNFSSNPNANRTPNGKGSSYTRIRRGVHHNTPQDYEKYLNDMDYNILEEKNLSQKRQYGNPRFVQIADKYFKMFHKLNLNS